MVPPDGSGEGGAASAGTPEAGAAAAGGSATPGAEGSFSILRFPNSRRSHFIPFLPPRPGSGIGRAHDFSRRGFSPEPPSSISQGRGEDRSCSLNLCLR